MEWRQWIEQIGREMTQNRASVALGTGGGVEIKSVSKKSSYKSG
jgi:hypothetical protein